MRLGLGLGLTYQRGGSAAPSLSDQMQALLLGTAGFVLDPSDLATMHQDAARTVPVALAADPVGNIRSKWGINTWDFAQGTAGSRPAWDGTSRLNYDGSDDHVEGTSGAVFQNAPAYFFCGKFYLNADVASQLWYFSTTAGANHRFAISAGGSGAVGLAGRRLDADTLNNLAGSGVSAATPFVVSASVDLAGTGAAKLWLNGSLVINSAFGGTAGNSSNTASVRRLIGVYHSGAARLAGWHGRIVSGPLLMSDAQRGLCESWVGEV